MNPNAKKAGIIHQGRTASRQGLTAKDNPYPEGSPEFRWWEQGNLLEFGLRQFKSGAE